MTQSKDSFESQADKNTTANKTSSATTSLEKWAHKLLNRHAGLSTFGLQTEQDVITFLRSPVGTVLVAEIGAEQARNQAITDYQRNIQIDDAILMHRLKAFLFRQDTEKHAHSNHQLRELTEIANAKAIFNAKTTSPIPTSTVAVQAPERVQDLERALAVYDKAVNTLEAEMKEIALEEEEAQETLDSLVIEGEEIDTTYRVINRVFHKFTETMPQPGSWTPDQIHTEINRELGEYTPKESRHKKDRASLYMDHTQDLRIALLYEILAVEQNDRYYVNSDGEQVASFRQADFVLSRGQRLVKDNGLYFLLQPGQDWDSVKENPLERYAAQEAFKKAELRIMPVSKVIDYEQNLELAEHQNRIQEQLRLQEALHAQKMLQISQLALLKSIASDAQKILKALLPQIAPQAQSTKSFQVASQEQSIKSFDYRSPVANFSSPAFTPPSAELAPSSSLSLYPRPAPGLAANFRLSQVRDTFFYRNEMERLRYMPNVTVERVLEVAEGAPDRAAAVAYLDMRFKNTPRDELLSHDDLSSILAVLEQFGIPASEASEQLRQDAPRPSLFGN